MLDAEPLHPGLVRLAALAARPELLAAPRRTLTAHLLGEPRRLGADEPRLFVEEQLVEVLEGRAGRLDVCSARERGEEGEEGVRQSGRFRSSGAEREERRDVQKNQMMKMKEKFVMVQTM